MTVPGLRYVVEKAGALLPFSCEQVFDVAADIERYPQFLKWWISAKIRRRELNVWYVEQIMGLGPIRLPFTSKAVLQRPHRIDVTSSDPPFRKYDLTWNIASCAPAGCRVSVAAEFELESALLQPIVNRLLPPAIDDIVESFEARAHSLYAAAKG